MVYLPIYEWLIFYGNFMYVNIAFPLGCYRKGICGEGNFQFKGGNPQLTRRTQSQPPEYNPWDNVEKHMVPPWNNMMLYARCVGKICKTSHASINSIICQCRCSKKKKKTTYNERSLSIDASTNLTPQGFIPHTIHVWYIHIPFGWFFMVNLGKIYHFVDPLGLKFWACRMPSPF